MFPSLFQIKSKENSGVHQGVNSGTNSGAKQHLKRSFLKSQGFTLTELIVVITILSILSVIGFTVMSHQSSVARDGKRISDIKTLSESARITSAQLRKLPTPIADSVSLTVSGTFIGYQGFMSTSIVNPLGYGSDKIYDPLDGTPYTYRVNQHYDQAQFLAYLENPRFERSIEIAGLMKKIGDIASLREVVSLSQAYALDTAYALDSSSVDLSSRYPYAAGDRLGIFLSKGSRQPLQNGVTGTGSRDISLSDASTLDIIVGSQGADEYVSTDISTGALSSLKDGSFDEKSLLGMNSGTGSGGDGGDSGGGGGGLPVSHILTMGEYSVMGNTYYGYIGPLTISLYATYGVTITTITPGSLIDDTVDGYVIDSLFWNSDYSSSITILAGSTDIPSNVAFETPYANLNCTNSSVIDSLTMYSCTGSTVSTDFYVGSQHDLGVSLNSQLACTDPINTTNESYFTFDSSQHMITGYSNSGPKDVVIPCGIGGVGVQIIGNSAFYNKQLTSVILPNSVGSIVAHAFYGNQLTSINLENVFAIGPSAFQENLLTHIDIPPGVNYLSSDAFANNQITSVNIPSGLQGIGNRAFAHNQLTSVNIPNTVTSISGGAFNDNLFPDNEAFIYNRTITGSIDPTVVMSYAGSNKNITIPNGIIRIGEEAFEGNSLLSVDIPNTVLYIGDNAFAGNMLTGVTIPSSVQTLGFRAFYSNQLTSVDIPTGISVIEDSTFQSNNLTSITIPSHINTIGANAFHNNKLDNIYLTNSLTSVGANAFGQQYSNNQNGTVYGPASGYIKDVYTNNLNNEFDKVRIPNYIDLP